MAGLIESLTEIIGGILNMIQAILTTILSTITGVFSLAGTTVKEGTYATGSVIDFLLSEFLPNPPFPKKVLGLLL